MSLHVLSRHPDTPCTAIDRVEVQLTEAERGAMRLIYRMIGAAQRVVTAVADEPPRRRDELWRHTCCELFVRDATGPGYREYNFAPSGDWAAYRFSDYRAGMAPLDARPPLIEVQRSRTALVLTVTLSDQPFRRLGPARHIGLACVVETATELSYWALAHAPGKPDFHHALAFASTPPIDHTAHLEG